jgi:hypothetical protein
MGANKIILIYHSVLNHANAILNFFCSAPLTASKRQRDLLEDYSTAAAERDPFAMILSKKV